MKDIKQLLESNPYYLEGMSTKNLVDLNKIVHSSLDNEDIKKAVYVYLYIAKKIQISKKEDNNVCDLFINLFLLNKDVNNKRCFSLMLDEMYEGCLNWNDDFIKRIVSFCRTSYFLRYFDDKDYYFYLIKLFNDKNYNWMIDNLLMYITTYTFDGVLKNKIKIIIDALTNKDKANYKVSNMESIIFKVLINDLFIELDNEYYRKFLNVCFNNNTWFVFYQLINNDYKKYLTVNKIKAMIDYYSIIVNKYPSMKTKELDFLNKEFYLNDYISIPLNMKYLSKNDEDYKELLESISSRNNSISYAKLLNKFMDKEKFSNYLDDKEEGSYVRLEGFQGEKYGSINVLCDINEPIINVLSSRLALYMSNDNLEIILNSLKRLINQKIALKKNYYNIKHDEDKICDVKIELIVSLFQKGSFYINNNKRLNAVLSFIFKCNNYDLLYIIDEFILSPNIILYTDEEFEYILSRMPEVDSKMVLSFWCCDALVVSKDRMALIENTKKYSNLYMQEFRSQRSSDAKKRMMDMIFDESYTEDKVMKKVLK